VLVGTHFPRLLDRFGPLLIPLLSNPDKAPTRGSSLFAAGDGGRETSGERVAKPFSLYTLAARHRVASSLGIAAFAGLGAAYAVRRSLSGERPGPPTRTPRRRAG
jgi:hypothetical protein